MAVRAVGWANSSLAEPLNCTEIAGNVEKLVSPVELVVWLMPDLGAWRLILSAWLQANRSSTSLRT